MALKDKIMNSLTTNPKFMTFGIGLAITFSIGLALGIFDVSESFARVKPVEGW
jgi:hypothetical protein